MCDHHLQNPCHFCWQSNFYHQYLQQHAAMTQWIQQLHQNVFDQNIPYCYENSQFRMQNSVNTHWQTHENLQSCQSSEVSCERRISSSSSFHSQADWNDEDDYDEEDSECEFEFNVDAIMAMRASKKDSEEDKNKSSIESESSFVMIEADDDDDCDFVERGGFKDLEPKRTYSVGLRNIGQEFNTEKEIKKYIYGEKFALISGLETAMSLHFEHLCDKHQPPLWPVLPLRL